MSKVAIVTGAAHGIGLSIASSFLSQGMNVAIADVKKLSFKKDQILFVKTDVSQESSVKNLIRKTVERFGKIDILINNAGILPTYIPPEKLPLQTWEKYIGTNLTGPFLCAKYAIPHLRKTNGSIVNIASTHALQAEGNTEPYDASKGGLISLTQALALSLGPDIRVNCISPGWIHTDKLSLKKSDHEQHPVGRVGESEDIAAMVSFLVSDQATFITGANFIVDGGMTKKMIYES